MLNLHRHLLPRATARAVRLFVQLRPQSTAAEPPPAGGHLPSIATSEILRTTRDAAIRTRGIKWIDDDISTPGKNIIGGRETRKMNTYQAVRDAMRYGLTTL